MKNDVIWEDIEDIYSRNIDWEQFRNCSVLITGSSGMLASYLVFMLIYLNEKHNFNIRVISMVRSIEKMKNRFSQYCQKAYFEIITNSVNEPILTERLITSFTQLV